MTPENTEQFFKHFIEFIQKSSETFFGSFTRPDTAQDLYQWWHDNLMNTLLQSVETTTGEVSGKEQFSEIFEKSTQQTWDWYQKNIGKYLHTALLGPEREDLMKIMRAIDTYNQFLKEMSDFSKRFNIPFQQAVEEFQKVLKEKEKEEPAENSKELYNFFLGILTKQYDGFLKSSEGVQAVTDVLDKYVEYRQQLNTVIEIWCKSLSIPTKTEMEEIYKDLHHLKKRTRQQETLINKQQQRIDQLIQKIQEFETPAKTTSGKRKTSDKSTTREKQHVMP